MFYYRFLFPLPICYRMSLQRNKKSPPRKKTKKREISRNQKHVSKLGKFFVPKKLTILLYDCRSAVMRTLSIWACRSRGYLGDRFYLLSMQRRTGKILVWQRPMLGAKLLLLSCVACHSLSLYPFVFLFVVNYPLPLYFRVENSR